MTETLGNAIVHGLTGLLAAVLFLEFFVRWKRNRAIEPGILFLLMIAAVLGLAAGAAHFVFPAESAAPATATVTGAQFPQWCAVGLIALGLASALAFYFKRRHRDIHLAAEGLPTCFKKIVMKHRRHAVEGNLQIGYSVMLFLAVASLGLGAFLKDDSLPDIARESSDKSSAQAKSDSDTQDGDTIADLLARADREENTSASVVIDPVVVPGIADVDPAPAPGVAMEETPSAEPGTSPEPEPQPASATPATTLTKTDPSPQPTEAQPQSGMQTTPAPMAARSPVIGRPNDFNPATKRPKNIPKDVFASHIRPILQRKCFNCHGSSKQKGDLRLDTPEGIRKGGKSGPIAVAGNPEKSSLYNLTVLPPNDPDIMPAKGDPLTKKETELLRKWILYGADLGDGKHIADASGGGGGFAVDQLAKNVPPADAALIESLKSDGVLIRPLSANQSLLEVDFSHMDDKSKLNLQSLVPIAANIHTLDLANSRVSNQGLAAVASMHNLVRLQLNRTSVGNDGLQHLKALSNLEVLNLYGTQTGDAGLDHLAGLKKLKKLYVWESKVTPEGSASLEKRIPGLKAVF